MEISISKDHYLHVREIGVDAPGRPTVLMLHGWAGSGRVWDLFIERWPRQAGRLLIADLRGAGWSAKPRSGYSLDDHVGDIAEVIDQLGFSKNKELILVGHSMGGTIAMRVALLRPQALSKLILVSPAPPSGFPLPEGDQAFFRSAGGHLQGTEQLLKMVMVQVPEGPIMQGLIDSAATVTLEAYLGGFDAWRTADFAEQVAAINVPTVVLCGALEQTFSPALLQAEVVARIPGARFIAIPGAGHFPQIEAPDQFAAQLIALISGAAAIPLQRETRAAA